jgi:hypothetical protein
MSVNVDMCTLIKSSTYFDTAKEKNQRSGLPGTVRATSRHALGILVPSTIYFSGFWRKSSTSRVWPTGLMIF